MDAFIPSASMIFSTVEVDRQRFLKHCKNLSGNVLNLDLSQVMLCDSAGLAFLIEVKRLARSYKKTCIITGMTKRIHALAEFCGVDKILDNE